MSIDRRQFKRFETLLIVEIDPQKENSPYFFGITKNISLEGFIFESQNYNLRPGDIFEFRLKHPKNTVSVPVFGEIVWVRETKFEYHSGVKFHRIDDETRTMLSDLISADTTEHSAYGTPGEEGWSPTKGNGRAEPVNSESEDMRADSTGEAAMHKESNQSGQGDKRNGTSPPVSGGKHEDAMDDLPVGGEDHDDTVKTGEQKSDAQKYEAKSIQKHASRAANSSMAARRRDHRRRRSYAVFAGVLAALFIATALIIFLSDDIRKNIIHPFLSSRLIKYSDTENDDSGMYALNETAAPVPSSPIDQSDSFTDDDEQTADGRASAETGMTEEQNGHGELIDHDYSGADAQGMKLPVTEPAAQLQDRTGPFPGEGAVPIQAASPVKIQSADVAEDTSEGQITRKDSNDLNIRKVEIAASEKKNEALQHIRTALQEESKPVFQAVKGNRAETSAASGDKKDLQQAAVQEKSKTGAIKNSDTLKKLSEPERDETVSQKSIAVQKPDGASVDTTKQVKTVSVQDKEEVKDVRTAGTMSRNEVVKRSIAVESAKKSKTLAPDDTDTKKESAPVRMAPAETVIAKSEVPRIETAESPVLNQKPGPTAPSTGHVPGGRDVDTISQQGLSKKPAGGDGMPRIALVVQSGQPEVSDLKKKQPEFTDEFLKKYFTAYIDPFDDNSNKWDIFDIGAASARIEDGLYHIENKNQGGALIVLHYQRFPHESDFVIEIAVRAIKVPDGNSFGFIFGAKDARDNYSFQIRENKYYSVKNYHHGESGLLAAGEIKDSLANKDSPALLEIVKQADDMYFYINSGFVDTVSNLEFYGNQIGFIVEGKSHIAIDYTRSYIRKADNEHTK